MDQLLIATALDPDLRRRLLERPEEVFQAYDFTEEEKEILRRPDSRLLGFLGAAVARQAESSAAPDAAAAPPPHAPPIQAHTLPDVVLALTLVPCAQYENGELKRVAYATWVNPLPEGADPAGLPQPPGVLPGQPLAPLYAVIRVSAVQMQDAAGSPQVGLWASLRQSSNVTGPPPPEAAGRPEAPPFGSDLGSEQVQAAVAAVRSASREERYNKLIDLMHTLRGGEVR